MSTAGSEYWTQEEIKTTAGDSDVDWSGERKSLEARSYCWESNGKRGPDASTWSHGGMESPSDDLAEQNGNRERDLRENSRWEESNPSEMSGKGLRLRKPDRNSKTGKYESQETARIRELKGRHELLN
jgi:hypothetical protein